MNTAKNKVKKQLALAIAVALATPSIALAEGFYVTAQLGVSEQASDSEPTGNNIATDSDFPAKFDSGDSSVAGIGIGYKFSEKFRIEGRLTHRDGDFNDKNIGSGARAGEEYVLNGNIESTALTVEGFYDFPNSTLFTPYIKAGLGVSDNSYSARLGGAGVAAFDAFDGAADGYYDAYADGDSTELSWNVGIGGNYKLSKRTSIYGEYQYASFGDVKTGSDSFTDGFKIDDVSAHEFVAGVRIDF
ncbi:porin family protein [Cocleimonas flava]|uniref:Opacity protein-like surface antigen n=1 Tax=Cocleimonas flava TaxID=634765 RepID=A0A4R1FB32_9GAMM|nr:porin [Cocleimonas flava]TCJ89158.1 opacity protein-like surface antigen [Cocleimonas flava]